MNCKLIVLDVDGTLVGPDSIVPPDVVDAIESASRAGRRVVLATGRSFVETVGVWQQLRLTSPPEPMIVVGGALVSETPSGRTLYQRAIPRGDAVAFSDALGQAGYAVMAILDSWRHGLEYVVAEHGQAAFAQEQWFSKMNVAVRRVNGLADADDMPDPLRVSAVVDPADAQRLAEDLRQQFDGRLNIHAIVAPNYHVTIVEAFAPDVDKFAAVKYVAQAYRIGPGGICAVGDDINDLEMISQAGIGVAMPNAIDEINAAADCVAEKGLAAFLKELIG